MIEMPIEFQRPEAFLLLPVACLLLRRRLWPRPLVGWLRLLVLVLLAAVLAEPGTPGQQSGRDLILLLDRSRSMPEGAEAHARELATTIAQRLQPGDRLGVLAFGRDSRIEAIPQADPQWPPPQANLDDDGSDLAGAIVAGLALLPAGRQGSLLVLSDGEANGGDLEAATRVAARQQRRIDTILLPRTAVDDLAVVDLQGPAAVPTGQPLLLTAIVAANTAGPANYRLLLDGSIVQSGSVQLVAGRNALQFQRQIEAAGLREFVVEISRDGDDPANNRGLFAVRADAGPRILCITPGGRDDRLVRSLRAAGQNVLVHAPASAPLDAASLDGFRAVILEDVAASDLPAGSMVVLADWVRHAGGGLLMTGGKASYGVGGYHRSPLEEVLPVTMEMREEQRRYGLAMAIALDRSGSMQMDAGGQTKMQLANRGTATAVEMLTPLDAVAVIAVDSAPHIVVPMQPVTQKAAIMQRCRSIESMGGGIYVGAALHAAAEQLASSSQQNRHIVLFADAADAEEPGDYQSFVPELVRAGITLSVIGLGRPTDSDGPLLEELARLGGGRCHFVADAHDLPRVFARETIQVARSALIEQPTQVQVLPALALLGQLPAAFPAVGGYSLAWPRARAERALLSSDEHQAPLLSYWQVGLGRTAALLAEADGPLSGELADWPEYGAFFATLLRWLTGGQQPGVHLAARRQLDAGQVQIEVEPGQAHLLDSARGVLRSPDGGVADLHFRRETPLLMVADLPLRRAGIYRAAVQLGDTVLPVPPLCLPYSPELAPVADPRAGERCLRRLALATGGSLQPTVEQMLAGPRLGLGRSDWGPGLLLAALVLWLLEVLVRRFGLSLPQWSRRRAVAPAAAGAAAAVAAAKPVAGAPPAPVASTPAPPAATKSPASRKDAESSGSGMLDALARAKRRSDRGPSG